MEQDLPWLKDIENIEIIISDNRSTDNTADICLDYAKNDSRIKFFQQAENIGSWDNFKFVFNKRYAPSFV